MKQIGFDGMAFGPDEIEANRQTLIQLRDVALQGGHMEYAVALSHTIAILAFVIEEIKSAP